VPSDATGSALIPFGEVARDRIIFAGLVMLQANAAHMVGDSEQEVVVTVLVRTEQFVGRHLSGREGSRELPAVGQRTVGSTAICRAKQPAGSSAKPFHLRAHHVREIPLVILFSTYSPLTPAWQPSPRKTTSASSSTPSGALFRGRGVMLIGRRVSNDPRHHDEPRDQISTDQFPRNLILRSRLRDPRHTLPDRGPEVCSPVAEACCCMTRKLHRTLRASGERVVGFSTNCRNELMDGLLEGREWLTRRLTQSFENARAGGVTEVS
jgi:hypothetical protein